MKPSKRASRRFYAVFGGLIKNGSTFLDKYTDDELLVIRDFLRGARSVITQHGDGLRELQPKREQTSRGSSRK